MRLGELTSAVKTANAALVAGRQSRQNALVAESLFRLSEAQSRTRADELSVQNARAAERIYRTLGDASGQGRSLWALAMAATNLGHADESRRAAEAALALCQRAGDLYGVGNALNVLTFSEVDIARNLEHLRRARVAFEAAGYLDRVTTVQHNLARSYLILGLFHRARRLFIDANEIARRMGERSGLALGMANLAFDEMCLGATARARELLAAMSELLPEIGDTFLTWVHAYNLGLIELAGGEAGSAVRLLEHAAGVARKYRTCRRTNRDDDRAWARLSCERQAFRGAGRDHAGNRVASGAKAVRDRHRSAAGGLVAALGGAVGVQASGRCAGGAGASTRVPARIHREPARRRPSPKFPQQEPVQSGNHRRVARGRREAQAPREAPARPSRDRIQRARGVSAAGGHRPSPQRAAVGCRPACVPRRGSDGIERRRAGIARSRTRRTARARGVADAARRERAAVPASRSSRCSNRLG